MPSLYSKRIGYYQKRYQLLKEKILAQAATPERKAAKVEYDKKRFQDKKILMTAQSLRWNFHNKEKVKAIKKTYYNANKKAIFAHAAMRRARKLNATPSWLTEEHKAAIKQFYANRPEGHHVDHITPLQGENVCGLHVLWNLQYLLAADNLRKGTKL